MKIISKRVICKFIQKMFFQVLFESIKISSTLDSVRGFIPKSWTNIRQSKADLY